MEGYGLGVLLGTLAVGFFLLAVISGFFLWIGAKLAGIQGAGFWRSVWAGIAASLTSFVVSVLFALFGLAVPGTLVGALVTILVIKTVYGTTFLRALICWVGYIVSFIIALFLAFALIAGGVAKHVAAKGELLEIRNGLENYQKDAGQFPTTGQGLRALLSAPSAEPRPKTWKGAYVMRGEAVLTDPWGRPYVYQANGPTAYVLRSKGPDGVDGNGDDVEP